MSVKSTQTPAKVKGPTTPGNVAVFTAIPGQLEDGGTGGGTSSSWSVLTNGDAASPELIFADGDVIMLEIPS